MKNRHEGHAAAFEVIVTNSQGTRYLVGTAGKIAVPSSNAHWQDVYRKVAPTVPGPHYFMERKRATDGRWTVAERSLQRLTFQQMCNAARVSGGWLRVCQKDFKGTAYPVYPVNEMPRGLSSSDTEGWIKRKPAP